MIPLTHNHRVKSQLESEQHLEVLLGKIVQHYANTTNDYVNHLFSGADDAAVSQLSDLINDGKWVDVDFVNSESADPVTWQKIATQIIYGQLIPAAWSQVGGLHPVSVFDDKVCNGGDSKGTDSDRHIASDVSVICSSQSFKLVIHLEHGVCHGSYC
jgi:hypothetical protein